MQLGQTTLRLAASGATEELAWIGQVLRRTWVIAAAGAGILMSRVVAREICPPRNCLGRKVLRKVEKKLALVTGANFGRAVLHLG